MLEHEPTMCYGSIMIRGKQNKVIVTGGATPDSYELRCAFCMCDFFNSDIEIVPSGNNPSPDARVVRLRQFWEIKNIRGNGKNTIHHTLSEASHQSENLIITLLRTKMAPKTAVSRLKSELKKPTIFKKVLLLMKNGKIIVVK